MRRSTTSPEPASARWHRTAFRYDLTRRAYDITLRNEATDECVAIAERYRDLQVGLTDASLVALAARLGTTEIASFDKPHFRVVRPTWRGDVFRLLPADA